MQYQLPHPLVLLDHPPTKESYKNLVKAKVIDYWENKLRSEASILPSLDFYFHPQYMSLKSPHKLWTTAGNKTYEVTKAKVQLQFLSNQYRCAKLTKHWTPDNPDGLCTFPSCTSESLVESPEHILLHCPAYSSTRNNLIAQCLRLQNPITHSLITNIFLSNSTLKIMQFFLDCSALPEVISSSQQHGDQILCDLFYCSRTWCYSLHRERMKRLGRWNFR